MSAAQDRRRRALRRWMLHKFGDGTTALCIGCGMILTQDTMTVDRYPIPGRHGGRYVRPNVRPMCHPCNTGHIGEPD